MVCIWAGWLAGGIDRWDSTYMYARVEYSTYNGICLHTCTLHSDIYTYSTRTHARSICPILPVVSLGRYGRPREGVSIFSIYRSWVFTRSLAALAYMYSPTLHTQA